MARIFVSKAGNDSNAGTSQSAPKLTIGAAITAASSDGDTVEIIDEGTYAESQMTVAANNVTLTHTASELGRPVLDASGLATTEPIRVGTNTGNTKRGFVLNGIEIKGSHDSSGQDLFDNANLTNNSNGMVISDCFIYGFSGLSDNIMQTEAGETFTIEASSFMFTPKNEQSIRVAGAGAHLFNNCFFSRSGGPSTQREIIDGFRGGGGSNLATASFCTFIYNDRVTNSTSVITRFAKVINCVIRGPGDVGGASTLRGIKNVLDHTFNVVNDMGSSGVPYADSGGNAESAGTGDLTSAVTFLNESIGETEDVIGGFALAEGSVGVNQATPFNSVNIDINGRSRPQGSAPDMGAFETPAPYWTDADGGQTYTRKFGSSLQINATTNRMATHRFVREKELRQAPYFITVPGPASIRGRTAPVSSSTAPFRVGQPYKTELG